MHARKMRMKKNKNRDERNIYVEIYIFLQNIYHIIKSKKYKNREIYIVFGYEKIKFSKLKITNKLR